MSSVCLRHNDRETDIRCAACLRPICEECVVLGPGNSRFCSQECTDNAQKSSERFSEMTRRDQEAMQATRSAAFSRMVIWLLVLGVLGFILYAAWPHLPASLTGTVESWFKQARNLKLN
jgi:hypothetical protein